jgi:sialate O-acetylesterase
MSVKGREIEIEFRNVAEGLRYEGDSLQGFAIAGADKRFVWATAKIDGNKVIVRADGIDQPVAVRYAWGDNPDCNLMNSAGLPAAPFRTDDWPLTTVANR